MISYREPRDQGIGIFASNKKWTWNVAKKQYLGYIWVGEGSTPVFEACPLPNGIT